MVAGRVRVRTARITRRVGWENLESHRMEKLPDGRRGCVEARRSWVPQVSLRTAGFHTYIERKRWRQDEGSCNREYRPKGGHSCNITIFSLTSSTQFWSFCLQIMDGPGQLSERTRPDSTFSILEVPYCALGKSGLARQQLRGKLFCFRPDLFQIFRVNNSFVLAVDFMRWVQRSRLRHHRQIGSGPRCVDASLPM